MYVCFYVCIGRTMWLCIYLHAAIHCQQEDPLELTFYFQTFSSLVSQSSTCSFCSLFGRYNYFICDNIFTASLLLLLSLLLLVFVEHHSLIAHSPLFVFLLFQSVKRRAAYACVPYAVCHSGSLLASPHLSCI